MVMNYLHDSRVVGVHCGFGGLGKSPCHGGQAIVIARMRIRLSRYAMGHTVVVEVSTSFLYASYILTSTYTYMKSSRVEGVYFLFVCLICTCIYVYLQEL